MILLVLTYIVQLVSALIACCIHDVLNAAAIIRVAAPPLTSGARHICPCLPRVGGSFRLELR